MTTELTPSEGWGVLHLFCRAGPGTDPEAVVAAVKAAQSAEHQVVSFSVFGHKADLGFMALGPNWVVLRVLQSALSSAGLQVVPWTANKPEDWQMLVDAKVDAIITDDPEALVLWLREKKLHP